MILTQLGYCVHSISRIFYAFHRFPREIGYEERERRGKGMDRCVISSMQYKTYRVTQQFSDLGSVDYDMEFG